MARSSGDFEQNFFGRGVAQAQFGIGQHFEHARQRVGVGERGLLLQRGDFGLGNFEQIQIAAGNLVNQQVAEMVQQIAEQPAQILAAAREFVQLRERGRRFRRRARRGSI